MAHTDTARANGSKRRALAQFLTGSVSGCVSAGVLQPFDVIKTRQQGAFSGALGGDAARREAMTAWRTAGTIVREEGATHLWSGLRPSLLRVCLGVGVYFSTLNAFVGFDVSRSTSEKDAPSRVRTFAGGAAARSLAALLVFPLSVVKTRQEWVRTVPAGGVVAALRSIAHRERVQGLYSGLWPTLLRDVPTSGLYVMGYQELKRLLEHAQDPGTAALRRAVPLPLLHFGAGVVAGMAATLVTQPADVVKTRLQLQVRGAGEVLRYSGLRQAVTCMWREEGWRVFFRGSGPRVTKRALQTALTWSVYEHLSQLVRRVVQ